MNAQITQKITNHVRAHGRATLDDLETIFEELGYDYFDIESYMMHIAKTTSLVITRDDDDNVPAGYFRGINVALMTPEAISQDDEFEYIALGDELIRFPRD